MSFALETVASSAWRPNTDGEKHETDSVGFSLERSLRSRIARRLFVLFLCAALLPIAGLALVSYQLVSESLTSLNHERLQQDAKSIGMGVIQRLRMREEALKALQMQLALSGRLQYATPLSIADSNLRDLIRSASLVDQQQLKGLTGEQLERLARGHPVMQITPSGDPIITLTTTDRRRYLQATLIGSSVWEDDNEREHYCLLKFSGEALYCRAGAPMPSAAQWPETGPARQNSGIFSWQFDGIDHVAAYWRIPLDSILAHEGLLITVSERHETLFSVLGQFRQLFPSVVILAMALAAGLAISQIRRQMKPLEDLERHAARVANGDFSGRLQLYGKDEFSRLADSFNDMSARLNQKFHLLGTLGELDRTILATPDRNVVIRLLLEQAGSAAEADEAGILWFDEAANLHFRTGAPEKTAGTERKGQIAADALLSIVDISAPWQLVDLHHADNRRIRKLMRDNMAKLYVFPAQVDGRLDSVLLLAYKTSPAEESEATNAGRSLADRLVATAKSISMGNRLYHQANYDALTDLPNRALLHDRMDQALKRAAREDLSVALVIVDLDRFKDINDSLGHSAGDALLVECARRMQGIARHTDTVARLGGDEFVLLIPDLPHSSATTIVDRIASTLSKTLSCPVDLGIRKVSVPASIGVAMYPANGADIHDLLKNADAAMYESKRQHHGRYRFYSEEMNAEIQSRFEMIQELGGALENGEFFLVYQPKIDALSSQVVGAEALIRWASPRLGLISPLKFIPLIEEIGLECRLGQWVIDAACRQIADWTARGITPVPVSVNISPAHFHSSDLIADVTTALSRSRLPTHFLELEILESTAIGETEVIHDTLQRLRTMGVGVALDDFGTGYSSLVYLTKLPATTLKIDRAFIVDLPDNTHQRAIVSQIISLARILNFKVVAEGVETGEQAEALMQMGCDMFQGYYFSKPLEPERFFEYCRNSKARPVPLASQ
ncbi:MAG: EAL domain-containing protein [Sphingomonadales bacterium]|nr:EAL domain-containing protein [Sphingomonadales bacterium]